MSEGNQEGNKAQAAILEAYRVFFSLLKNYREGNYEKLLEVLNTIRAILHEYQKTAGASATSRLLSECYHTVLDENPWAKPKTDFWSDR